MPPTMFEGLTVIIACLLKEKVETFDRVCCLCGESYAEPRNGWSCKSNWKNDGRVENCHREISPLCLPHLSYLTSSETSRPQIHHMQQKIH